VLLDIFRMEMVGGGHDGMSVVSLYFLPETREVQAGDLVAHFDRFAPDSQGLWAARSPSPAEQSRA
jgi:hypothetical protein